MRKKGIATIAIAIAVVVIVVIAGLAYYLLTKKEVGPITKSPDEMVLTLSDLPLGWQENIVSIENKLLSLDDAAGVVQTSVDNLQQYGYDAGFERMFSSADGQLAVVSSVLRFSDNNGAKEALSWGQGKFVIAGYSEVEVTQKIGDECAGYTETTLAGFTTFAIIFREANVLAGVEVAAPTGRLSFDNVIVLAQIVEGRM